MSRAEDLIEIHQVASLYAHLIDNRDFTRMGEVYSQDATYESTRRTNVGLAAIVEYLSTYPQPLAHNTANVYVELDPDGAHARGVAKYVCVLRDGSVVAGDYEDRWVRTDAGWRLEHRRSSPRVESPGGGLGPGDQTPIST